MTFVPRLTGYSIPERGAVTLLMIFRWVVLGVVECRAAVYLSIRSAGMLHSIGQVR